MKNKHRLLLSLALIASSGNIRSQESTSVFNFLNLPTSAHTTALGGKNISLIEDDISLAMQNPSLLASVSDKTVGVGFMTYMQGTKAGNAAYCQTVGERGTWGVQTQFVGYGSIKETNDEGVVTGDMKPLDFCIAGQYSHMLSERIVGGVNAKFIYSHYGEFSSCALAVDLGFNYMLEEKSFSLSAVARNLGGQVKAFGDSHERLPFDREIGFTKGLGHAPVCISLTMVDLTRWKDSDYYSPDGKVSGGRKFTNHFVLGVDIKPAPIVYVSGGFNFRRAYEMKAAGSSHASGLSFGAGLDLKRMKVGVAYAKYHVSSPTFSVNLAYNFQKKTD